MQPALADLADDLVAAFLGRVGHGFTAHGTPAEIDRAVEVLRPAAAEAAAVVLIRFIGEAVDKRLSVEG